MIFGNRRQPDKSRQDYMALLKKDVSTYYSYNKDLISIFFRFFPLRSDRIFRSQWKPRPKSYARIRSKPEKGFSPGVDKSGCSAEPLADWTKVGLKIYNSAMPIGATPEYMAGHYILQAASSFMPCAGGAVKARRAGPRHGLCTPVVKQPI